MKRVISICFLALLVSNCTTSDTTQDSESNFYALTVGNSWEYKWYAVSNEGNQNPTGVDESITIVDTDQINGNLYYKFKRIVSGNFNGNYGFVPEDGEHFEYYRDSLGFLINNEGLIKFTNSTHEEFAIQNYVNFGYEDGQGIGATLFGQLSNDEVTYESSAGSFPCLEMTTRILYNNGVEAPANNHIYYSEGIGLISDDVVWVASYTNAGYLRILQSYNVQ